MGLVHPTAYLEGEQFCGQLVVELDNGKTIAEAYGPYSSVSQVKAQFTRAKNRFRVGDKRASWNADTSGYDYHKIVKVTPHFYVQEQSWEEIKV